MAARSRPVRVGIVGLEHPHVVEIAFTLMAAGAEIAAAQTDDEERAEAFAAFFADARRCRSVDQVLDDDTIDVIVPGGVPADRADVAVRAMGCGKHVLADKPAATTEQQVDQLAAARTSNRVSFTVFFSERIMSRATARAQAVVGAGGIGEVVQILGLGPHRLGLEQRPGWFLDPELSGGILCDLASHQIDQFVTFARLTDPDAPVELVSSMVANFAHPAEAGFQDFGEVHLRTPRSTGFGRVDWYSPDSLDTWGDVRLFVLGTDGYLEARKNIDIGGRPGGDHLLVCDGDGPQRVDCSSDELPFATTFLEQIRRRDARDGESEHCLEICRLAAQAQSAAEHRGNLSAEPS